MNKRNLISLVVIVIIVAIVGLVLTREQISPAAILAILNRATPTPLQSANITQGDAYFLEAKFEQAFASYTAAIDAGEDLAQAYSGRGNVYTQRRYFREAAQDYSSSLKIERDPLVLSSRCNAYRLLAKFDLALIDCQEAIQLDPENIDGYVALTALHMEKGELEEAKKTIEQAMAVAPDVAILQYVLGQVELLQGHSDAAIQAFDEAIRLDPNQPQFYWDRGFAYYSQAKLKEASENMKLVIEHGDLERDGELIYKAGSLLKSLEGALNP